MKPFTKLASVIFGIIALAHLVRLIIHFQVMIGSHQVPMWASIIGVIITAILSYGLWREGAKAN